MFLYLDDNNMLLVELVILKIFAYVGMVFSYVFCLAIDFVSHGISSIYIALEKLVENIYVVS